MRILGIETSCDETAAAVVDNGTVVLSSIITSTKDVFATTGGVIPEDAARRQLECLQPVISAALQQADVQYNAIDAIAITAGPGLLGSLLVGVTAARTIGSIHHIPLIGVHHTFGHLCSVWLDAPTEPQLPCITLSASGGHTDLWYRTGHTSGQLLGRTRDDAAGETFDKGAAVLGLPYPGGPSISTAAQDGDETAYNFPIALQGKQTFDYSFSGLKTALKRTIVEINQPLPTVVPNIAASFQLAICRQLVDRIVAAVKAHPDTQQIHLVGGVSANQRLRRLLQEALPNLTLITPSTIQYCTDNAAMIASAGYFLAESDSNVLNADFITRADSPLEAVFN